MCDFPRMSPSPFTFVPVFIAISLHIAGCAAPLSPEAECFAAATVDYRAAWRAAEAISADLARGHALEPVTVPRTMALPCRVDGQRDICLMATETTRAVPIAIDRVALLRRLAALEARMDRLRPPAMQRAAPCGFVAQLAGSGSPRAWP